MVGQLNINTCRMSALNDQNLMYKIRNKIVSKFVEKQLT